MMGCGVKPVRVQGEYNERNGIKPQSLIKPIDINLVAVAEGGYVTVQVDADEDVEAMTADQRKSFLGDLEERMREAARKFEFEKAAQLRDRIKELRTRDVTGVGVSAS